MNKLVHTNEIFKYLDGLRESGETNMFGAPAYVQKVFNMDKKEAINVVTEWMKQFKSKGKENE